MHIIIAAIGKDAKSPAEALTHEYLKRLPWEVSMRINDGRKLKNKTEETAWLMDAVSDTEITYILDEKGKELTSLELADLCKKSLEDGVKSIAFVIGGADGLDKTQLPKHIRSLCFGRMTWPHLMVRAMLAEQLYRASSIISGHPYHRA